MTRTFYQNFCVALFFCTIQCVPIDGYAQTNKSILLWPNGAPAANGTEQKDKPQLIVSIPKECNSTAIVILPGGGYGHLAMGHEGKEIAEWFNKLGIAAFICDYRHRGKGYGHPAPMQDAQRAIQTVRANAQAWGIDPNRIGVIGFSAGGHLASTVSNHFDNGDQNSGDKVARQNNRPDFAILGYPVIALGESFTHRGSQINLLGKEAAKELVEKYSNEKQVTEKTPPTFLWSTADDGGVKVENSLRYFAALRKNKVAAALHVFPTGRHGLGMAKNDKQVSQWTKLCENWLKSQGLLSTQVIKTDQKLYWVFLTTGKSTVGVEKSEIQQIQKAHIANFVRLANDGKLLTVGPVADPDKKLRGIVVIKAENKKALKQMFVTDPYVNQGFMNVDATEMKFELGEVKTNVKPDELGEYRIAIFRNLKSDQSEATAARRKQSHKASREYLKKHLAQKNLYLLASMSGDSPAYIAIFKKMDDDELAKIIDKIPLVREKICTPTIIPLYVSKGSFEE